MLRVKSTSHRVARWRILTIVGTLITSAFGGCAGGCRKQQPPSEVSRHPFTRSVHRVEEKREVPRLLPDRVPPSDLIASSTRTRAVTVSFSGAELNVELEATPEVPEPWLSYLAMLLEVVRAKGEVLREGPTSRVEEPIGLRRGEPEIALRLTSSKPPIQATELAWKWPGGLQLVRPGVVALGSLYEEAPQVSSPVAREVGTIAAAGATIERALLCKPTFEEALPIRFAEVRAGDWSGTTDADGKVEVPEGFLQGASLEVVYEAAVSDSTLQVTNDLHSTRSEPIPDDWIVRTLDCELWVLGTRALEEYQALRDGPPPAGGLQIHRWGAASGVPYAPYDYVSIGTNFLSGSWVGRPARRGTLYHELGHTVAFVADGSWQHWLHDATKWRYARFHERTGITNEPFAWSEGWANFWQCGRDEGYEHMDGGVPADPGSGSDCPWISPDHPPSGFVDWNQDRVAERLGQLADDIADPYKEMVALLESTPGQIHSLWEFEKAYCEAFPASAHCEGGAPTRVKEACPPGFSTGALLCERHEAIDKPRQDRGAGVLPVGCGEDEEDGLALCYAPCDEGYEGAGPICWEQCPEGYDGGGAFCRKDLEIISSDNSACPWYDKCGLTFAAGCSTCPGDYDNDGCTCTKPAHIYPKDARPRGVGELPTECSSGMQYDAGLCYPPCPAGFAGVGPVCWGQCPPLYQDWGATCHFIETVTRYTGS